MPKIIYKTDEDGFVVFRDNKVIEPYRYKNGEPIYEIPDGYVDTPLPGDEHRKPSLYKPRWTGEEWIEGMTQEEIDNLNNQFEEKTDGEKIQELTIQQVTKLDIENNKKDIMIANLTQSVANLNIEINKLKGGL